MDFTDKLLSSFIAFEDMVNVNDPVHEIRTEALKRFEQQGFPTKKQEAWKYTSLQELLATDYSIFPKAKCALEYASVRQYFLHEMDTFKIVFVDGQYSSFLSETTHDGVDVCLFSAAIEKPKYKHVIDAYFNKVANTKDSLTNLNTSFANEGAYIFIPKGKAPLKPIEIVHFATGNTPQILLQPRNLIVLEEGAEAQIIERHQALAPIEAFTNSVTEIFAEKNAILDYYKFQNDHQTASLIDNTYIDQKQGSEVRVHTLSFGNKLVRNNLNFYQNGEHCNSILKGVTLASERQHIDHFTLVHHAQPIARATKTIRVFTTTVRLVCSTERLS
jgi:Fe-S cluster assembly protein SufD